MVLNNIIVVQTGSEYHFYTETNIYLGGVLMPANGQFAFDTKMLDWKCQEMCSRETPKI